MDVSKLARFRADPDKVRVSIRPIGRRWYALVGSRSDPAKAYGESSEDPYDALFSALYSAEGNVP